MKKKFLFSTLLLAGLFWSVNVSLAAPPPPSGGHHGAKPMPHHSAMHRPIPPRHMHPVPRHHNHHVHHVRHSGFISPCYCPRCYPLSYYGSSIYYPAHHFGHWGASFHISL